MVIPRHHIPGNLLIRGEPIPKNGWPDHQRYEVANPFAMGLIPLDRPVIELTQVEKQGRRLFLKSCISCHDRSKVITEGGVMATCCAATIAVASLWAIFCIRCRRLFMACFFGIFAGALGAAVA